jgi:hypothetical protein
MRGTETDGYRLALTCARCGGPVRHIADGTTNGWTVRAVAQCADCNAHFVVAVTLADAGRVYRPKQVA